MPDYIPFLLAELRIHGVTDATVDRAHKHPQIRFTYQGRKLMYVTPSSPSDKRGHDNALSNLRSLLGVKRIIHKSASPRRRRNRTEAPPVLSFTVRQNPLLGLLAVRFRVSNGVEDARNAGAHAYMAGLGDAPPDAWAPHLAAAFRAGWWRMHGGRYG